MTSPREEWHLPVHRLGRRVLVYDRLDSTNRRAAQLAADPANDGVAVLAEEQTAGRGQHGRSWLAAPGASVLLSLLLFPPPPLRRPRSSRPGPPSRFAGPSRSWSAARRGSNGPTTSCWAAVRFAAS